MSNENSSELIFWGPAPAPAPLSISPRSVSSAAERSAGRLPPRHPPTSCEGGGGGDRLSCPMIGRPRSHHRGCPPLPSPSSSFSFSPSCSFSLRCFLALLLVPMGAAFKLDVPSDLRPVQLVRKPKHSQGMLELTDEGIAIIQNLTAPFAIVSAVGPTRTGKSSLLGRAFLNLPAFFEAGTGAGGSLPSPPLPFLLEHFPFLSACCSAGARFGWSCTLFHAAELSG